MKIYLDLVLFINFFFDFLLLVGVSLLLRRTAKINRLLCGAFIGSLSIFTLFLPMSSFSLFLFKVVASIFMCLASFGFRSWRYTFKNLFFLYTESMVLGGGLYFLNIQFSYRQEGIVFFHNGFSINLLVLGILSPVILYTYVRQGRHLKNNYHHYYPITLEFPEKTFTVTAFLDTGNQLVDIYTGDPVILFYTKDQTWWQGSYRLLPYYDTGGSGMLKCITADRLSIEGIGTFKKVAVALMTEPIHLDGIDCILNEKLWEGFYDPKNTNVFTQTHSS